MSTYDWHATDEMLDGYTRGETGIDVTASVEAHLLRCAECRARVATAAPDPVLERAWTGVLDTIQAPPEPPLVRLLLRFGLSPSDGVLVSVARSLSGAWALASIAVVLFAALAAPFGSSKSASFYLLVAPLVPVIGVVIAFASMDPLDELAGATPYSKARLALLRTVAVIVTSVPLAIGIGLVMPGIVWLAFVWLLPSLALTVITLLLMTWWSPEWSGSVVTAVWVVVSAISYADDRDVIGTFSAGFQLLYLAIATLAAVALATRIRAARTPGGYA